MHDDHRWEGATLGDHPGGAWPPERQERDPYFLLWIVYLFFRPRTFFRHFIDNKWPSLLVMCAWVFGMAKASDRLITRGTLQGTNANPIYSSWTAFWVTVLITGALGGLLYFYIGGWWYRLRLRWSGDPDPDKTLARRVYLYAAQIMAIPVMIHTVSVASMYATPADMANAAFRWWDLIPIIFVPWSIVVSFVGVRTVFDTGLIRSLIWFLILPISMLLVAVVLIFVAAFLTVLAPPPPETGSPRQHRTDTLVFDYPSNWWIDTQSADYDPGYLVEIEPPQDAYIRIQAYAADASPAEVLESTLDAYRSVFSSLTKRRDLTNWHGISGVGREQTGTLDGNEYVLMVFERPVDDGVGVEIIVLCLVEDEQTLRPGFELIARSLNFSP